MTKDKTQQMKEFANQLRKWNRGSRIQEGLLVPVFLSVIVIFLMLRELLKFSGIIALYILFGISYGWIYCNSYVNVEGKNGKMVQGLSNLLTRMPFSMEDYCKEIGRRLCKNGFVIAGIQFLVVLGIRIFFQRDDLFLIVKEGLFASLLTYGAMLVFCHICKRSEIRQFALGRIKENKQSQKSNIRKNHTINDRFVKHPVKVIVVIYIEVFLAYGIFDVVSHLQASLKDGELYRMVHDGFGIDFIIYMCMILMGEQVICALIKEKVKWKQLMAGIVGLVVTITYGLTVYDSYYEDKIVVQRFIKNTEYDWEDVQSYSVCGRFSESDTSGIGNERPDAFEDIRRGCFFVRV